MIQETPEPQAPAFFCRSAAQATEYQARQRRPEHLHLGPFGGKNPSDATSRNPLMKARIKITLKNGVLDPQGKAIEGAVRGLGITGVGEVRQGKYIEVALAETAPAKAKAIVEQMCKDLLANTVIENYSYEIG